MASLFRAYGQAKSGCCTRWSERLWDQAVLTFRQKTNQQDRGAIALCYVLPGAARVASQGRAERPGTVASSGQRGPRQSGGKRSSEGAPIALAEGLSGHEAMRACNVNVIR